MRRGTILLIWCAHYKINGQGISPPPNGGAWRRAEFSARQRTSSEHLQPVRQSPKPFPEGFQTLYVRRRVDWGVSYRDSCSSSPRPQLMADPRRCCNSSEQFPPVGGSTIDWRQSQRLPPHRDEARGSIAPVCRGGRPTRTRLHTAAQTQLGPSFLVAMARGGYGIQSIRGQSHPGRLLFAASLIAGRDRITAYGF
jgi:hypothetical protein